MKKVVHSNEVSVMKRGQSSDNCSWFREFQGAGMLSKSLGKLLLAMGGGTLLAGLLGYSLSRQGSYFRQNGFQPTCPRRPMPDLWPTERTTKHFSLGTGYGRSKPEHGSVLFE
jgi:hypothetical protein